MYPRAGDDRAKKKNQKSPSNSIYIKILTYRYYKYLSQSWKKIIIEYNVALYLRIIIVNVV